MPISRSQKITLAVIANSPTITIAFTGYKPFSVTIALPAAIIAAAEAIPLMVMASKSSAFSAMTSSIGKPFALNSFRSGLFKGGSNLFGQLATNDFKFDDKIDFADPLISGFTGGWGSVLGESAFEIRIKENGKLTYGYEGHQDFVVNAITNSAGNLTGKRLEEKFSSLSKLSIPVGSLLTDFVGGTLVESGENILGNELNLKIKVLTNSSEK